MRSKTTSVRLAQRAQIVLLAAQGLQNKDIAERLGIGRVQVARWRERYLQSGLQGIGTTTLFAALNVLDGQVIGQCQQRHTHAEWLKFLRKIDRETPKDRMLHPIADNYATHKHPVVQEWLARHPHFNMHFTPTSASWLNLVERFFRDITVHRLRRGVFTSVADAYVARHNTNPKPFIWTKSADDILQKVIRANSRSSSKQNAALRRWRPPSRSSMKPCT